MPTDVVMPQMGESIAEGTIVRWIKKVGDAVEQDEALLEISTDKVDTEVQSPVAGVLSEIRAQEGETVAVNTVVAVIGSTVDDVGRATPQSDAREAAVAGTVGGPLHGQDLPEVRHRDAKRPTEAREGEERLSPVVRRLAKEHGVDISQIHGSGAGGRVTKEDILSHVGQLGEAAQRGQVAHMGQVEKMSPMRKKIAEHMVLSRHTSAHVHSVFEVDFTRVAKARDDRKSEYERSEVKLTFLSFIIQAAVNALRAVPIVNASIDGENIVYHQDINIGVAVALEWGLIVPVIKNADRKDLAGITMAVADLAARARSKQLKAEEVAGGTFTITNPGALGSLFGLPIINQPQVAILAVGNIAKRPVVVDDAVVIRLMGYMALGYDHRLIDGAVAESFIARMKNDLENWSDDALT